MTGIQSEQSIENAGKTILKLQDWSVLTPGLGDGGVAHQAVLAMEQLAALINHLRSPAGGCPPGLELRPETLVPYVTDEVQEVLDALRSHAPESFPASPPTVFPSCLSIEELIPQLLWLVVRSSYEVMQLIEGVHAEVQQPGTSWQLGMVRLVVLLQADLTDKRWQLDLATQRSPDSLLPPTAILRLLPQDPQGHLIESSMAASAGSLSQCLQQILGEAAPGMAQWLVGIPANLLEAGSGWRSGQLSLQLGWEFMADCPTTAASTLVALPPAELPPPSNDLFSETWLSEPLPEEENPFTDTLEEFALGVAQAMSSTEEALVSPATDPIQDTLEDFALAVDQSIVQPPPSAINTTLEDFAVDLGQAVSPTSEEKVETLTPVEILPAERPASAEVLSLTQTVEVSSIPMGGEGNPKPEPGEVTALRMVEPDRLFPLFYNALQQRLAIVLAGCEKLTNDELVDWLVRQASTIPQDSGLVALLPLSNAPDSELLMDSLSARLLWQLIHTSYDIMRLVGGVATKVLQPQRGWEMGMLRLLVLIQIQTGEGTWDIDLATGRPVAVHLSPLDSTAIVHPRDLPLCQQPTPTEALIEQTIARFQNSTPAIAPLLTGVPVEVCVVNQGWQPAHLQLRLSLAFVPDGPGQRF